jgi:hypothetical protein
MNTKTRIKAVFTLVAVALVLLSLTAGSAHAALTIKEQFVYTAGESLAGKAGGTGFSGAWATTSNGTNPLFTVQDGGLSFIPLETAGNSVYRTGNSGRAEANRAISAASQAALFADGTTIWFSVLYQKTGPDGRAAFVIGTDTYDVGAGGQLSHFTAGGEGFGFGSSGDQLVTAISYDDIAGLTAVDSTVDASTVKMIAGKIVWNPNGTDDELYLYDVTDLSTEPTTPIATVTADLDQSAFDLVALQHSYNNTTFDEIRIGTTVRGVVMFDPNNPSVNVGGDMITLSGMGVDLAPTVVNNDPEEPQRPLSYEWTTDAPGGYTIEWDPSNTVEAPTVTITPDTPGNPQTVTLTLKVDLVGTSSSASDTMTIDVYEDTCLAAKAAGTARDQTDIDENCITELKDYALLAATWLVDYALTEPVPK